MANGSRRSPAPEALEIPSRRRATSGLGAGAIAALAGACAAPAALAPRTVVAERAPRAGATWAYGHRSEWPGVAPRTLAYTVTAVTGQGVQDRLSQEGSAGNGERLFTPVWEIAARPLAGRMVHELSPYLLAFGDGADVCDPLRVIGGARR